MKYDRKLASMTASNNKLTFRLGYSVGKRVKRGKSERKKLFFLTKNLGRAFWLQGYGNRIIVAFNELAVHKTLPHRRECAIILYSNKA